MVLTIKPYKPLMVVDDTPPGGINHPAGTGLLRFAARILTRYGEVVVDFGEFQDLLAYNDNLSVEGAASNWTLRMKATRCNQELLKRIHPGYAIEVYCARNTDPLKGVVRDPTTITRIDTTPDLSVIPSAPPAPPPSGAGFGGATATSGTLSSIDQIFSGGGNSFIAIAVGTSEGNRTADGGFTRYYNGHTDPGNGASNIGSFSVQGRGRLTAEQADANQIGELQRQMPRYRAACQAAGLNPNDLRLLTNFCDLHTQSPRAARNFLNSLSRLNGNPTFDSILQLRVAGYTGRSTLGARLPADQRRRMTALESAISARGGAIASSTTTATGNAGAIAGAAAAQPQTAVQPPAATPTAVSTQQTKRFTTTLAAQRYGAPRDGGRRRHAGVDLDIPNDSSPTAISFIGGVVTRVERRGNPPAYGNLIDVWNANLGVVERIAEFNTRIVTQVGATVLPGQALGRGEGGSGVFHYEIRTSGLIEAGGNKQGGFGFDGTTDPVAYLRSLGVDPYAEPSKVFANARIQPPAGGIPVASGSAPVPVAAVEIEGPTVKPVDDYYLDKCPHLLLHGVITDYGFADGSGTTLTISGEGYGLIYKDSTILLDINSPSTNGQAFEVRTQAQVATAVSLIYYQILKNWVESFWGEVTGWEARTRPIPLPPNYSTRINEGSAWSALQYLCVDGFFHLWVDHTGAIVWEKLPWSGKDQALIAGRNWEDLDMMKVPSWKIIDWNDRLSEQGVCNFLRIVPTMQGQSGGTDATGLAGMCYNVGSIRQYGGPTKREYQVPYGTAADQWYTSAPRREAQATYQTFADLCVLEAIRWFDRPVQRLTVNVRGESAWRIGTRLEITENWHCQEAKPGQYYVTSRGHTIDLVAGNWRSNLSLVRDRRDRYLGIGVGAVPIVVNPANTESNQEALESPRTTGTEDFSFANVQANRTTDQSAPNAAGAVAVAEQSKLQVPLPSDEYYFFDRSQSRVIPIGNDPIAYANRAIIATMGQVTTTEISAPTNPTDQIPPNSGGADTQPADVATPQLENDSPPRSYNLTLERNGQRLTEVPSPINGTVVFSGRSNERGNSVEIRGSDGRSWVLSHLDTRGVRQGQRVRRGQPIGNQGATGNATAPTVLVEIRSQNRGRAVTVGDRAITRPLIDEYLEMVRGTTASR